MNICDNCGARGPKVTIADGCPECGTLVGWPVPGSNSSATDIAAYDVVATDEQLEDALRDVAIRNLSTLMRRKRKAEAAAGFDKPEVADAEQDTEAAPSDAGGGGREIQDRDSPEGGQGVRESGLEESSPAEGDAPQTP